MLSAEKAYNKVMHAFGCENNNLIPENWTKHKGKGPPILKQSDVFQNFLFPRAKRGDLTIRKIRNNENTMPNKNPYWVRGGA